MKDFIIELKKKDSILFIVTESFSEMSEIFKFYIYFKENYEYEIVYFSFTSNNKTFSPYKILNYKTYYKIIKKEFDIYQNANIILTFKIVY